MSPIPAIIMLVAIVMLGWLLLSKEPTETNLTGETDVDELREAEQEVQELDAWVDPDDADDHIPDWGPGVPRP